MRHILRQQEKDEALAMMPFPPRKCSSDGRHRPPLRTQLSVPSECSSDFRPPAPGAIVSGCFMPDELPHEPFSVFYQSTTMANTHFSLCCAPPTTPSTSSSSNSGHLHPGPPFFLSPEACAQLTDLFLRNKVPSAELHQKLVTQMLSLQPSNKFDQPRRSSLAPSALMPSGDFAPSACCSASASPDSLFFAVMRKNSFVGQRQAGGGGETQKQKQRRRRAVIIVDAQNNQILIASDSVCRLFGLRDRSLIGKSLGAVFPVAPDPALDPSAEDAKGPLLLQNVLFADKNGHSDKLRAVYGQTVDILDADGRKMALSIWSYPLSSPSAPSPACANVRRKSSAILMRSPSAFLPPTSSSSSTSSAIPRPSVPSSAAEPGRAIPCPSSSPSGGDNIDAPKSSNTTTLCPAVELSTFKSQQQQPPHHHHYSADHPSLPPHLSPTSSNSHQNPALAPSPANCFLNSGYSPRLEEVQEEESLRRQHSSEADTSCVVSSTESKKGLNEANQHPHSNCEHRQTEEEEEGLCPDPTKFPLNETEPSVGGHKAQPTAAEQQPDQGGRSERRNRTAKLGGGGSETQESEHHQKQHQHNHPPNHRKGGAPTKMVQAGVHQRSGDEPGETALVVVIPNGADNTTPDEPQQKGILRHQNVCKLLPNISSADEPPKNNSPNNHSNGYLKGGQKVRVEEAKDKEQQQRQQQQNMNNRWLILMEPIDAMFASVILGAKGRIFRVDDAFAAVLGYDCTNRLFGTEIHRLIPSLNIGSDWVTKEQFCCGSTIRHNGVPFSVTVNADTDQDSDAIYSYEVRIRSLASINGVITLTESGTMHSYNENFFHELLGMQFDEESEQEEEQMSRKSDGRREMMITDVLPHFFEYLEVAHFLSRGNRKEQQQQQSADLHNSDQSSSFMPTVSHSSSCLFAQELTAARRVLAQRANSFYDEMKNGNEGTAEERTEEMGNGLDSSGRPQIIPGIFYGLAKHVDGMMIPVKIEVSNVAAQQQQHQQSRLFAVCIGFDRSIDYGINQMDEEESDGQKEHSQPRTLSSSGSGSASSAASFPSGLTRAGGKKGAFCLSPGSSALSDTAASVRTARFCIGEAGESDSFVNFLVSDRTDESQSTENKRQEVSLDRLEDESNEAVCGEYSKYYDTFQLIGNGAFGSVKLAARKDTGLLAVSKFICKAKVLPESWVQSPRRDNRMIPIEVHLLENLNHPNIVRVLECFENEKFYQLVMEKCGCGMDLFEFIDHQPKLDEPLISFIFRQIVSAVDYLHQNHIVHRDLKDENVIIDQYFCCKLIDFGSAAFFGEGIVFSTFCGTMEYCSPEVLTGNKYLGPELEMWSLGILLYTLIFFENPFRSAKETVHAEIELPWDISEGLYQVLSWLLQPDPKLRATVAEIKLHWWLTQKVDQRRYNFKELLRNCERAQVAPPLYVSDLQNHLKRTGSVSCSNLAGISITSTLNAEAAAVSGKQADAVVGPAQKPPPPAQQQMGVVSAR